jgi:hypothetical protein
MPALARFGYFLAILPRKMGSPLGQSANTIWIYTPTNIDEQNSFYKLADEQTFAMTDDY